jgi:hypothetical protein
MSWPTAVEVAPVPCINGPSSPGLSTRTEIEMLHPMQAARSGGDGGPDSQLQSQFHSHSDDVDATGVMWVVPSESSEQFQLQFQTQSTGPIALRSGSVTDVVFDTLFDIS